VKLRIDDISAEERDLSFTEPEQDVNRVLARGSLREYHVKAPIDVSVSHYRAGSEVFVSGKFAAATQAICSRCAEEFDQPSGRSFRYVLVPRAMGDGGDNALKAEDLEFSFYNGEEIDLTPLVREQVLLALTERPLCREDCRRLCPRCGANLNERTCDCIAQPLDSRFTILRNLKLERR